ncbi:MAG TPA: DUF559 domain-containing protein [Beijerinckiaceae bacterium]|jgi:very-short-patch-repair endonuclease
MPRTRRIAGETDSWPPQGWRVLRFWNAEMIESPNAVLARIGAAVGVNWDPF